MTILAMWPTTKDAQSGNWDSDNITAIDEQIDPGVGTPDGSYMEADWTDDGEEQIVDGFAIEGGGSLSDTFSDITSITAWLYARWVDSASSDMPVRIRINGSFETAKNITLTSSWTWHYVIFTGTWNTTYVEAIDLGFQAPSSLDFVQVGVACLDVTGTAVGGGGGLWPVNWPNGIGAADFKGGITDVASGGVR